MGMAHEFLGDHFQQFSFNFKYIFPRGKIDAIGDAEDVGIHAHRELTEGGVEDHVGRLATHAGQRLQFGPRVRDLRAVPVDQELTGFDDVPCLAVV